MSALDALAAFVENWLGDELASRQFICETVLARLREMTPEELTLTQAFRDAIAWQREHRAVEDWPGQIRLYERAAAMLGLDPGEPGPPPAPVTDPSGRQLAEEDVALLSGALEHAIQLMDERTGAWCEACISALDGACDEHAADSAREVAYRDLAERLGGAR